MAAKSYKIRLDDDTRDFIRRLHPEIKKRIRIGLEEILKDPSCGKPLQYELLGLLSFRVQRFRIVYKIEERIIYILGIGHRETIYLEMLKMVKKSQ